jgi:hypothetical protein
LVRTVYEREYLFYSNQGIKRQRVDYMLLLQKARKLKEGLKNKTLEDAKLSRIKASKKTRMELGIYLSGKV